MQGLAMENAELRDALLTLSTRLAKAEPFHGNFLSVGRCCIFLSLARGRRPH